MTTRKAWADYFDSEKITYAFFSAYNATAAQEQAERQRRRNLGEEGLAFVGDEEDESLSESDEENPAIVPGLSNKNATVSDDEESIYEDGDEGADAEESGDDELEVQAALAESIADIGKGESAAELGLRHQLEQQLDLNQTKPNLEDIQTDEVEEDPRTRVLSVLELEELFERVAPAVSNFATEYDPNPEKLMVGLVGYPNVGKSSTINALLGEKKVSVSATPGKTKHFQTLNFSPKITLCDCPGLVFPQFVNTEADMVCDGVLPIDQMREYSAPVELVCRRIPREILELHYGIRMEVREIEDGGTGLLHWEDLLSTYASTFYR